MGSDVYLNCPSDVIADAAAKSVTAGVYRYVITSRPSSPVYAFGTSYPANFSLHAWDVFGFYDVMDFWMAPGAKLKESDRKFSDTLQREIMTWIKTGKPSTQDWKPYPGYTALIDEEVSVTPRYKPKVCDWWLKNDFFKYAWMN